MATSARSASDVEIRLMRQKMRLTALDKTVDKNDQLAANMHTLMNRFTERLNRLEVIVKPLNEETKKLQLKEENIHRTRSELASVLEYFKTIHETVILDEPTLSKVNDYVAALERLRVAMSFFQNAVSANGEEYLTAKALLEKGEAQLERLIFTELTRHSRQLPSNILLDLIDDDQFQQMSLNGGNVFDLRVKDVFDTYFVPLSVVKPAAAVCEWMLVTRNATQSQQSAGAYLERLIELRASNVRISMSRYRQSVNSGSQQLGATVAASSQQQQSNSSTSSSNYLDVSRATPSGVSPKSSKRERLRAAENVSAPLTPSKRQVQKKLGSSKRHALVLNFSEDVLQQLGLQQLAKRSAGSGDAPETGSFSSQDEQLDSETFVNQVQVGLCALQAEVVLLNSIVPESNRRKPLDDLTTRAFGDILADCDFVSRVANRLITKGDFNMVLCLIMLFRTIMSLKPSFDLLISGNTALKQRLQTLMQQLHGTLFNALENYAHLLKNTPEKMNMPKDGTVHELTSNTMMFLESLLDYSDVVGVVLNSSEFSGCQQFVPLLGNQAQMSFQARSTLKQNFGQYVTKVLGSLGYTLSLKVDHYPSETLRALFTMNNYNHILRTLRRSGLLQLAAASSNAASIEQTYEVEITKCRLRLRTSWDSVRRSLRRDNDIDAIAALYRNANETTKLPEKHRQAIKDKFAAFNKELESLVAASRDQTIADREIRAEIVAELQREIVEDYERLYSTFAHLAFTKNREKYVRYSRADQLSAVFETLFLGGGATVQKSKDDA